MKKWWMVFYKMATPGGRNSRRGDWKTYRTLGQVGHEVGSRGRASSAVRVASPVPAHAG